MVCVHEVAYLISFNKRSCDGNECQMKMWTLRIETRVSIFIDIGGSSAGLLNHVNNNTHFAYFLLTMIYLTDMVYSTKL